MMSERDLLIEAIQKMRSLRDQLNYERHHLFAYPLPLKDNNIFGTSVDDFINKAVKYLDETKPTDPVLVDPGSSAGHWSV